MARGAPNRLKVLKRQTGRLFDFTCKTHTGQTASRGTTAFRPRRACSRVALAALTLPADYACLRLAALAHAAQKVVN